MAQKKKLSEKSIRACKDLIEDGAVKKDLAKSVGMSTPTLKKRLDEYRIDQLEQENAELRNENSELKKARQQKGRVLDFPKRKEA